MSRTVPGSRWGARGATLATSSSTRSAPRGAPVRLMRAAQASRQRRYARRGGTAWAGRLSAASAPAEPSPAAIGAASAFFGRHDARCDHDTPLHSFAHAEGLDALGALERHVHDPPLVGVEPLEAA